MLREMNGTALSHREYGIRQAALLIASCPEAGDDGAPDWASWIFEQRESGLTVQPSTETSSTRQTATISVATKMADQAWQNLPTTTYCARRLNQERSPVNATRFADTLRRCYRLAVNIDPRLRLRTRHQDPPPQLPGQAAEVVRPYTYPTTPASIVEALDQALGSPNRRIDLGEVHDLNDMRLHMPDPERVFLNSRGDVWFSRDGANQALTGILQSANPEDRSCWPPGVPANDAITPGERELAKAAAPEPPFHFPTDADHMPTLDPITAAAWLNRITPQQARARYRNEPEPGPPNGLCPNAPECPTACGYVQRAQLIQHTLFPDGGYDQCHFRRFRLRFGKRPDDERHQRARQAAERLRRNPADATAGETEDGTRPRQRQQAPPKQQKALF